MKRRNPSSEGTVVYREEGDLAHPRRASQLRDSAGFSPDFASTIGTRANPGHEV